MSKPTTLAAQLEAVGVKPAEIKYVAVSHTHPDHIGNVALFPQAMLLVQKAEYEWPSPFGPRFKPEHPVTKLEGDHDVFGDGSVTMVNLPGHTPGHHGLLVRLASGPVLLSGDTYHFAEQVANRGVPPFNTDRADSLASMDRFDRLGRNLHARIIIQHEPADVAKLPAFPASAR